MANSIELEEDYLYAPHLDLEGYISLSLGDLKKIISKVMSLSRKLGTESVPKLCIEIHEKDIELPYEEMLSLADSGKIPGVVNNISIMSKNLNITLYGEWHSLYVTASNEEHAEQIASRYVVDITNLISKNLRQSWRYSRRVFSIAMIIVFIITPTIASSFLLSTSQYGLVLMLVPMIYIMASHLVNDFLYFKLINKGNSIALVNDTAQYVSDKRSKAFYTFLAIFAAFGGISAIKFIYDLVVKFFG